jgi:hypothetical protein
MTLPFERTRSVIETEKFLVRLITPKVTPGVPKSIREEAKRLLRHYPSKSDMAILANGWNDKLVQFTLECPFSHPDKGWYD